MNQAAGDTPQVPAPAQMRERRWDALRHRVVHFCFGRLFSSAGNQLCEPGGLPVRGIHRVLICRPNHRLGNAVLISPLLAEIETLYPGAEIDLISAGDAAQSLFADRFHVRRVFSLPRKVARHLWQTLGLLGQLRSNSYDLAIDACNGSQSGRLLLALVKARFKLGFPEAADYQSAWHALACPEHLAQRSVFLLRHAYAGSIERPYFPLNLQLSEVEKRQAQRALAAILEVPPTPSRKPVIGIFANATGAKCYGEEWWKNFVDDLLNQWPELLIVDVLAEHGRSQLGCEFVPYYTRDLRRLAAMISNMDGFISADCGVMHLAVASGTPTLGLFAVTSAEKYCPYGSGNMSIDTRDMNAQDVASAAKKWLADSVRVAA